MSKNSLANVYSRSTGLKLGKPYVNMLPFPLPFDNYIVIYTSSGNAAKNYDYWQIVVDFILPKLKELNINIVQLGGKDDQALSGVFHLQGQTTLAQTAHIVNNSKLVVGSDSMLAHMAGILNVDVVSVYGCTSASAHGPHWKTDNTILIESHRNGKAPSFSFNENPKTVNLIHPEEVVNSIYKVLKIKNEKDIVSINIGSKYNFGLFEVVLDNVVSPDFYKGAMLILRYDYLENQQNLANQLSVRLCSIITDKEINLDLLRALKKNIHHIEYEVTLNSNPKYVSSVQRLGIPIKLFSRLDEEKIKDIKLDYFDIGSIEVVKKLNKENIKDFNLIDKNTLFKTNKILLSGGRFYSSNAHRLLDIPRESIDATSEVIIDTPKFFDEQDHFYLYNENN